jgi:AraC-like DNA-binding protein
MAQADQRKSTGRLHAIPTAVGGIARAAHARLVATGADERRVLKQAGLTASQIMNASSRIGVRNQIKFLNLAADELEDEFLGVHLAQTVDLRELGLLYYIQASSEKLGDALQRVARYSSIHNEGLRLNFRRIRNAAMSFQYAGVARIEDRHQIEFFVSIIIRVCRHLTSRHLLPTSIRFAHRRRDLPSDVRAFFGCDASFSSATDEVVYSLSTVNIPIVGADPYLNSLLVRYCEEALAARGRNSNPWQVRVENAIAPLLPHGQAHMEQVCQNLGVTRRTLARRLAFEKQTFSRILHRLRFELAKRYLQEPDLPVSEIAWLLGYRETSAFNHAFKRWTGSAPSRAQS